MSISAFEGTVENGQIRLPKNVHLPERARVYVIIAGDEPSPTPYVGSPRLVHPEQLVDFRQEIIEEADAKLA